VILPVRWCVDEERGELAVSLVHLQVGDMHPHNQHLDESRDREVNKQNQQKAAEQNNHEATEDVNNYSWPKVCLRGSATESIPET
jgi:hypothetical protein